MKRSKFTDEQISYVLMQREDRLEVRLSPKAKSILKQAASVERKRYAMRAL